MGHDEAGTGTPQRHMDQAWAAGSLQTTAADYARFVQACFQAQALTRATLRQMLTPQIAIRSESIFGQRAQVTSPRYAAMQLAWCLGWGTFKTPRGPAYFHTGQDTGFQNYTVVYPDQKTELVLLSNSENFGKVAAPLAAAIIGDTYSPFDWLGFR